MGRISIGHYLLTVGQLWGEPELVFLNLGITSSGATYKSWEDTPIGQYLLEVGEPWGESQLVVISSRSVNFEANPNWDLGSSSSTLQLFSSLLQNFGPTHLGANPSFPPSFCRLFWANPDGDLGIHQP